MKSADEIDRLMAEAEGELARLNIRKAELLSQIAALQQEKAAFPQTSETRLQSAALSSITNQSPQEV